MMAPMEEGMAFFRASLVVLIFSVSLFGQEFDSSWEYEDSADAARVHLDCGDLYLKLYSWLDNTAIRDAKTSPKQSSRMWGVSVAGYPIYQTHQGRNAKWSDGTELWLYIPQVVFENPEVGKNYSVITSKKSLKFANQGDSVSCALSFP